MLFNSKKFLIFFPAVMALYYIVPKKYRYIVLLVASYIFYMSWNPKYIVLLLTVTLFTYLCGLLLNYINISVEDQNARKNVYKKFSVGVCCFLNLGILGIFKYLNFGIDNLNAIAQMVHIQLDIPRFDILLPVGISFYTFQALSYIIDVYRGEIEAEKNPLRYALFVSFFPQLVAGPIERSKNLLRQLRVPRPFHFDAFREGILLMYWGFFLKVVVADRIAIFVDTVFANDTQCRKSVLIVSVMLFAMQIYCDFAGYSTIAIGSAKMLGIDLMENFDAPYLSKTVSEFWRRWHISLSSWFKDYLYIPLGGNRKGKISKFRNIMIVFLLSGLWHGANWTYVIWGGLNGAYQIVGECMKGLKVKCLKRLNMKENTWYLNAIKMVVTFLLVDFSWLFFRADSLAQAGRILEQIGASGNVTEGKLHLLECGLNIQNMVLLIVAIGIIFLSDSIKIRKIQIRTYILKSPIWIRWVVFACVPLLILLFGVWGPGYDSASFIYFQF